MATITTGGSGNWSSTTPNAPWPSGILPTSIDDVVIANTHTLTIDTTAAVARTVVINSGGVLASSTSSSSTLTLQLGLTNNGSMLFDMSTVPNVTATILLNASNNATSQGMTLAAASSYTFRGATKKSYTFLAGGILAGATSCTVDDAAGWLTGDTLIMATTGAYSATPYTDTIGPITVSGLNISWSAATANPHANDCPVGNFTRNLRIGGAGSSNKSFVYLSGTSGTPTRVVQDVEFFNMTGGYTSYPNYGFFINGPHNFLYNINNCSFYNLLVGAYSLSVKPIGAADCVFFLSSITGVQCFQDFYVENSLFLRGAVAIGSTIPYSAYTTDNLISGYIAAVDGPLNLVSRITDCRVWSCARVFGGTYGFYSSMEAERCSFGTDFSAALSQVFNSSNYPLRINAKDCYFQESNLFVTSPYDFTQLVIENKNNDPSLQEEYYSQSSTVPIIKRTNSVFRSAMSSFELTCLDSGSVSKSFNILARAGEVLKILCYVMKSSTYGSLTLPSVTISGLGISPVTATMSESTPSDTWELLEISVNNTASSDGNLSCTITAQSANVNAKAYFSGLPAAPYITRCRHYGYLFDETNPTRTPNPIVVSSEATAAAYTGVTIDSSTPKITVASGTADTFRKVYDYIQAWACLNVDKEVLLTSTDGINFSVPLTCKVDWPGMGDDGTLSGGWLLLDVPGSLAINLTGTKIEFETAGTYTFTGNLSGTVELVNSSGGNVVAALPSGASYTNTGPNITVTLPVLTAEITVTNAEPGSLIQLYDTDTDEELYLGTGPYTWSEPYTADRTIRIRAMYTSGTTAKLFKEEIIGTITASAPSLVYRLSQQDDAVYAANGVDGSTITGITINDNLLLININTSSISLADIYAYETYWLSTEEGIVDETRIITAVDTANYIFSNFKIKNTGTGPLVITGGYMQDADTGGALDIIDTSGGTIFLAPDHVVPYAAGAEATVAIVQSGLTAQGYTGTRAGKIDNLDVAVSSVSVPTAEQNASAVRTELATELAMVEFANKVIKNKREISTGKDLVVYDDDGTTPILQKALKDKTGGVIADLGAGVLALEEASTV